MQTVRATAAARGPTLRDARWHPEATTDCVPYARVKVSACARRLAPRRGVEAVVHLRCAIIVTQGVMARMVVTL